MCEGLECMSSQCNLKGNKESFSFYLISLKLTSTHNMVEISQAEKYRMNILVLKKVLGSCFQESTSSKTRKAKHENKTQSNSAVTDGDTFESNSVFCIYRP